MEKEMKVCKGNEEYATPEVMEKVRILSEKVKQFKQLREEIIQYAEDSDLWHLQLEYGDISECDPESAHIRWLASNHNC